MTGSMRDWQTRIRLWAAMIQGAYAIGYLLYYAVGLISPDTMEDYLDFVTGLGPISQIVCVVLLIHIALGLLKIYQRNTFRMPLWEATQIVLGLSIPFFLFPHFVDSYGFTPIFGTPENYVDTVVLTYPPLEWQFIALVLTVAVHAQIGTHAVLRLRPWYPRARLWIALFLSIIPIVSIAGYLDVGSELRSKMAAGTLDADDRPHLPTAAQDQVMLHVTYGIYVLFGVAYATVFIARAIRVREFNRRRTITVHYSDGRSVSIFPETTILEASRIGGIPHASVCGGRARCTTCRVKVESGMEYLSEIAERETRALKRIAAAGDVRLACQAQCLAGEVSVTLLLPPEVKPGSARRETVDTVGRDVRLAVLFADLRGFTSMSEGRLPYDVVFILNKYFSTIGTAIEANGGTIDKFLGDGLLAYFGPDDDGRTACRNAIEASRRIAEELERVNEQLRNTLPSPLKIGIGLHYGETVLGEIGSPGKSSVTIVGDTVNTASRLQTLNKKTESELIMSTIVAATAGIDLSYLKVFEARIRGRTEPQRIYVVPNILNDLSVT